MDEIPQRLARYYTPAQLEQLKGLPAAFEQAVAAYVLSQPDLRLVTKRNGPGDPENTLRISQHDQDGIPLLLQVTVTIADEARRKQVEEQLEAYLAQAVSGLPARDRTGSHMS